MLRRNVFLPRNATLARYMLSPCVRPSVTSRGTTNTAKLGSRKQRRTIAQGH